MKTVVAIVLLLLLLLWVVLALAIVKLGTPRPPLRPKPPMVEITGMMSGWCPGTPGTTRYIVIDPDGTFVGDGYCWSGPSKLAESVQ
jgi:hypothetical protein